MFSSGTKHVNFYLLNNFTNFTRNIKTTESDYRNLIQLKKLFEKEPFVEK